MTPDQLFLQNRSLIERVARSLCRRHHFSREETDDFVSEVYCKIIADDYAVLRKFKGVSTIQTFLTTVVSNHFRDHLDSRWGKWRTSAEAKRLGPLAVQLERLLVRERFSFDEACEILRTNHHVGASRQELADLAAKLPHRNPPRRRMESEEVLENRPSRELTPDERLRSREEGGRRREILQRLKDVLRRLPKEDALIARMRSEFKVSEIARTLRLDQKPLYRRLEKIFDTLRKDLESHGVSSEEIQGLFSGPVDDDEPQS